MMDWLAGGRHRLPALLGVYFAVHVLIRTAMSTSLDFDESEQVLLSQFMLLGYNSQPPLYTWIQRGLFEVLGYSVFSLALLKNLFIWMTYWFIFESIRKATNNLRLASIATLGMLTIPQIAWESHRDLSHTVAATFATALLCYAVISLAQQPRVNWRAAGSLRWYALIGLAVGLGILFKYNFAIVVVSFLVAALSLPRYRPLLLDRGIFVSVLIAGGMILPHARWMIEHPDLVSSKTVTTLTTGQSEYWVSNVAQGMMAFSVSLASCCALTVCIFVGLFVRKQAASVDSLPSDWTATRQLIERFLLTVMIVLLLIVLSGHAIEFKNRWFQPFICLVPAYLALLFAPSVLGRRRAMNVSVAMTMGLMLVILIAVISRPLTSRYRGKYSWLNIPYAEAAELIRQRSVETPKIIVTADARIAGNMKVQYPDAIVISRDAKHLAQSIASHDRGQPLRVLALADSQSPVSIADLAAFAEDALNGRVIEKSNCRAIDVGYVFGAAGDTRHFLYSEWKLTPLAQPMAKMAARLEFDVHQP